MFRRSGGGGGRDKAFTVPVTTSTGSELPVDGAVRVTRVDRIQAYNLVSRPSVYHAVSAMAVGGPAESVAVSVVRLGDVVDDEGEGLRMFRRSGGGGGRGKAFMVPVTTSTGSELPVDGTVRVTRVDRIQAYNLVSRPSVYHAVSATAVGGPAESLAVSVVRLGDVVDDEHDGFISVFVA